MRDQEHAAARIGKAAQVIEGMDRQVEVEPGRRLIGNDEPRLVHEGAHEEHPARHAPGELMGIHPLHLGI